MPVANVHGKHDADPELEYLPAVHMVELGDEDPGEPHWRARKRGRAKRGRHVQEYT